MNVGHIRALDHYSRMCPHVILQEMKSVFPLFINEWIQVVGYSVLTQVRGCHYHPQNSVGFLNTDFVLRGAHSST